jgi:uncharacterized protein
MEIFYEQNRIGFTDETETVIAEVTFPPVDDETVNINHTFVDDSLRGQGVASKLLSAAADKLREEHKKVVPTCSYAVQWFDRHPDYADLLKK